VENLVEFLFHGFTLCLKWIYVLVIGFELEVENWSCEKLKFFFE